jgi:Fe-S-cluster containining protein
VFYKTLLYRIGLDNCWKNTYKDKKNNKVIQCLKTFALKRREPPMNSDKSMEMLQKYMDAAQKNLSILLDTHGVHLNVLKEAMALFIRSLVTLPPEAACKNGCAFCCHLRVGLSIPEVIIIFNGLTSSATPEGLDFVKQRVIQTAQKGNTLDDGWWRTTRTACPFLDIDKENACLIYDLRPFSCRAYHSTDVTDCQKGFETGQEIRIPCFPLYRAVTDMYSTVFIRKMAQIGLDSYQVGFVRALQVLFEKETAMEEWFRGKDVFSPARIS